MNHQDHKSLIRDGVTSGGVWADLGSGEGAFTLALRDIAGEDVRIYSVDKDAERLERQRDQFNLQFPGSDITFLHQDFTHNLPVPQLDGILMANSLHYIKDQEAFLRKIQKYLKPHGTFLLVEYNDSTGNQYVPYAVSYSDFEKLAEKTGFKKPQFLHSIPSHFLKEIYASFTQTEV